MKFAIKIFVLIIIIVGISRFLTPMFFPYFARVIASWERKFPVVCQIMHFSNKTNAYSCLATVAVDTNNVTLCKSLDLKYKNDCLPLIAGHTGDAYLCTDLTDSSSVQACLNSATSYNRYRLEFCGLFTDQNKKDECFQYIGIQKHDNVACSSVLNKMEQSSCYEENASYNSDPNMCKQIKDSKLMGLCYYRLAVSSKNPQACNDLHDEYSNTHLKDSCLLDVAIKTGDVAAKEKICLSFNNKPRDFLLNDPCKDVKGYAPVK